MIGFIMAMTAFSLVVGWFLWMIINDLCKIDDAINKLVGEIDSLRKKDGAFDRIDALEREIEKLRGGR